MRKAVARMNRQWRAIDRKISTDYNGKLSHDAFFFAIDFAHRREDSEYGSNDGTQREKCSDVP